MVHTVLGAWRLTNHLPASISLLHASRVVLWLEFWQVLDNSSSCWVVCFCCCSSVSSSSPSSWLCLSSTSAELSCVTWSSCGCVVWSPCSSVVCALICPCAVSSWMQAWVAVSVHQALGLVSWTTWLSKCATSLQTWSYSKIPWVRVCVCSFYHQVYTTTILVLPVCSLCRS